jgi:hypothetical protein
MTYLFRQTSHNFRTGFFSYYTKIDTKIDVEVGNQCYREICMPIYEQIYLHISFVVRNQLNKSWDVNPNSQIKNQSGMPSKEL